MKMKMNGQKMNRQFCVEGRNRGVGAELDE